MGTRITTKILFSNSMTNLQRIESDLAHLQEQLASGRRINRPSDDPVGTRRAVGYKSQIRRSDHFLTAIRDAQIFVDSADSTLDIVTTGVQRVKTLLLQAANTTVADTQREAIATEVNEILKSIVDLSNTTSNGRQIFAGTRTMSPAFEPITSGGEITNVQYNGNSEHIRVQIDDDAFATINVPGDDVFQGSIDVFQWLINTRDDIRAGDLTNMDTRIGESDTVLSQILNARASYGATANRLNFNQDRIEDNQITLQDVLSQTEDADFADIVTRINLKQAALSAALSASAKIIQPSLLDFI